MTPDQKRAHLALHGLVAMRLTGTLQVRIARRIVHQEPSLYETGGNPMWVTNPLTVPERYVEVPFSNIPDELLDRLDLSFIEQFLSTH